MNPFRRWLQNRARRAGKAADRAEEQGRRHQWFLLAGWRDQTERCHPQAQTLQRIFPPDEVFWADPFAWSQHGRYYVFVEEFVFATGRAHISVIELDSHLQPVGAPVPVVVEPRHLSYPFLFEFDGQLYMVPETSGTSSVDLYRCAEFPLRWQFVRTLIAGRALADATLFEHDGRWWLFCTAKQGKLRMNETLFAFHADSPLSDQWSAHPANPLVRDYSCARPAGRVFRDASGRLLRPSQDCVRRYGHALNLSEITTLTPRRFRERRVWRMSGEEAGGWRGLHHMDWHDGLLVMDALRLLPGDAA
ncbi:MAG: hypothetical protein N2689_06700 [Verrucomicrobiae bacterium]|nr:hypothetical protein [Verrucomicrobiae bacterium]